MASLGAPRRSSESFTCGKPQQRMHTVRMAHGIHAWTILPPRLRGRDFAGLRGAALRRADAARRSDGFGGGWVELPQRLWLPITQQCHRRANRAGAGNDVHEPRTMEVRHQKLRHREGQTRRQSGRPDTPQTTPAGEGDHHPERNEQREKRQLPAHHRGNQPRVQPGDLLQRRDGNAQRPEGHRRGVGDERQSGGMQGLETKLNQDRPGDRHRRAEAGHAFDECAKRKCDQDDLNPRIRCDLGQTVAQRRETARAAP
jgi:hypothetical protein